MIRILMHGCGGRMGQVVSGLASADPECTIVAGVDPMTRGDQAYPVFSHIQDCTVPADVIVDFAVASAVDDLLDFAVEKKIPLVLCTTGLSQQQLQRVEAASAKVAILRSANMSLGVNMLLKLLKEAAEVLGPAGFDVEIIEKHHNQKVDAPSGTAIAMADAVREGLEEKADQPYFYRYDRHAIRQKRDSKEIGISAVRGGTIVGEHDVLFAGEDEVITFQHTAYSKAIFGKGALAAAKYLAGKTAGLYSMADVVGA